MTGKDPKRVGVGSVLAADGLLFNNNIYIPSRESAKMVCRPKQEVSRAGRFLLASKEEAKSF